MQRQNGKGTNMEPALVKMNKSTSPKSKRRDRDRKRDPDKKEIHGSRNTQLLRCTNMSDASTQICSC